MEKAANVGLEDALERSARGDQLAFAEIVSRHQAIARWKVSELGWRRVA